MFLFSITFYVFAIHIISFSFCRIIPKSQSAGENDFENVPQEVTFQPGETGPKFVDIVLINDGNVEPIEEFTVSLASNSSVILGNSSSVNIHDDDGQ